MTPWTVAHQAPLSMGFSRQQYWSGFSCPSPGDLPNPAIEPWPPALQADSLPFFCATRRALPTGGKGAEGCGEEVQLALLGISALPTTSDCPHLSTHNGYYSAVKKKHEVLTFAETQMDFEGTMLSEISQTEKDKYCMISLISEI